MSSIVLNRKFLMGVMLCDAPVLNIMDLPDSMMLPKNSVFTILTPESPISGQRVLVTQPIRINSLVACLKQYANNVVCTHVLWDKSELPFGPTTEIFQYELDKMADALMKDCAITSLVMYDENASFKKIACGRFGIISNSARPKAEVYTEVYTEDYTEDYTEEGGTSLFDNGLVAELFISDGGADLDNAYGDHVLKFVRYM